MKLPGISEVRRLGFYFRLFVYLGVLVALFASRRWIRPSGDSLRLPRFPRADSTLVIAGGDLAPELIARLVADYRRDYPTLTITLGGGGTTAALEALANGRADVGFLASPPEPAEQALLRVAGGGSPADTALWFPVALGALVIVAEPGAAAVESLTVAGLRGIVGGTAAGSAQRVHLTHPDRGAFSVFRERLGAAADTSFVRGAGLVFHSDDAEVLEAVRADAGALGVVSSFRLPDGETAPGLRTVPIARSAGEPAALPTVENVGYGRYPLYQHLYVATLSEGEIQGSMFVTQLTSDRGQRRVERAGFIPARLFLREVVLSRDPVAGGR